MRREEEKQVVRRSDSLEVKEDGVMRRADVSKVQQLLLNAVLSLRLCVHVCVYPDCWPISRPSTCGSIWFIMNIWTRWTPYFTLSR